MKKSYVVLRNFHFGEIVQNLVAGEKLSYSEGTLVRERTQKSYDVSGFDVLVRARLIVEDQGQDIVVATKQAAELVKPTVKMEIVQQSDRVVALIRSPEIQRGQKIAESKKTQVKSSRMEIVHDQRVVVDLQGKIFATPKPVKPVAKRLPIVRDESIGIVVAKVDTPLTRKTEPPVAHVTAPVVESAPVVETENDKALKADIKQALAKRATKKDIGFPKGYPEKAHWKKRVQWCHDNDIPSVIRSIHRRSTDSFKKTLAKEFVNLKLT